MKNNYYWNFINRSKKMAVSLVINLNEHFVANFKSNLGADTDCFFFATDQDSR